MDREGISNKFFSNIVAIRLSLSEIASALKFATELLLYGDAGGVNSEPRRLIAGVVWDERLKRRASS